jgi:ABC-type nitrate/sulfonate/bicarbonate transport system substrate-binding protein
MRCRMRRHAGLRLARLVSVGLFATLAVPASAQTKINLVTFAGATNLPVWTAIDKGFFAKEGLDVTQEVTRGSVAQLQGLMSGKYQFGSSALDNIVANTEGEGDTPISGFDLVGIMGVHSGMNRVVTRPEIRSYADIKGKTIATDALNSGYGLVLMKILAMNGLELGQDYMALPVGSGPNRLAAMKEGKAVAAALSAPDDIEAKKLGFNILGDTTEIIGAYQGSAIVVRRAYAKEHEAEVLAFIRAIVAATDFVFTDKAGAIAEMKQHIKGMSDADLEEIYTQMVGSKGGLNRGSKVNMDGVKMLLTLRNDLGGSAKKLTDPAKYVDLSYYAEATGGK